MLYFYLGKVIFDIGIWNEFCWINGLLLIISFEWLKFVIGGD